jgi:hypothetical protein
MDVLTFFSALRVDQVALGAIVTFGVVGLLRGWVVPRAVMADRIADKDAQIALLAKERDDWHGAYDKGELSRQELVRQNSDLIEAGQTTNRLMESLRTNLENSS